MAPTRGTDADRALDYQHTEIGVIPAAWSLEPLLKVVSLPKGQVDPRREPYSSMVLIAPDHVESSTGRVLVKQTAEEQGAVSGKYSFSAGDIVYSKIRPYLRKAILADFDGICSADMYPLRPAAGGKYFRKENLTNYLVFYVRFTTRGQNPVPSLPPAGARSQREERQGIDGTFISIEARRREPFRTLGRAGRSRSQAAGAPQPSARRPGRCAICASRGRGCAWRCSRWC